MDDHEQEILAKAVAERVAENTKELLETVAQWAVSEKDTAKSWIWFTYIVILCIVLSAEAKLSSYLIVPCLVASYFLFEWWLRRKARKKWQRHEFARQHFRALLECRKKLKGMAIPEHKQVKEEIVKWFLGSFFPGGVERSLLWDGIEQERILFPALGQMRLESMGLRPERDDLAAEYAYKAYSELDPNFQWMRKLIRGGL